MFPQSGRLSWCMPLIIMRAQILKVFGPGFLKSGVDEGYMEQLKTAFIRSLKVAIDNLEPAEMSLA